MTRETLRQKEGVRRQPNTGPIQPRLIGAFTFVLGSAGPVMCLSIFAHVNAMDSKGFGGMEGAWMFAGMSLVMTVLFLGISYLLQFRSIIVAEVVSEELHNNSTAWQIDSPTDGRHPARIAHPGWFVVNPCSFSLA